MEQLSISCTSGESTILIGEKFASLSGYLPNEKVFIVTDSNIALHYLVKFPQYPVYIIEPGEASKTVAVYGKISRWLLDEGADRSSFLLGVGGGVVCDLTGFVASTFMRGIEFGFVATTLLAQVDASVGGKNGVNIDGFKNIIGSFSQPKFVLCDPEMLATLPREELINGFAEIVKHALISDFEMFKFLEANFEAVKASNLLVIEYLVKHSVEIKTKIVQADERDKGERRKLNLGHTYGHAVEKLTGLPHGQCVSIGIEFAARLSVSKGFLEKRDYMRLVNLLKDLELPVCISLNPLKVVDTIAKDKKKTSNSIDFILLKGIGSVVVEKLSLNELREFVEHK